MNIDPKALLITGIVLFFNARAGERNRTISDFHNLSFTPNPRTFTIWAIIYSLLTYNSAINSQDFKPVLSLYALSGVLNVAWLNIFLNCSEKRSEPHNHVIVAAGVLCAITVVVWKILSQLQAKNPTLSFGFGLYAAWTTVASLLNISMIFKERLGVDDKILGKIVLSMVSVAPFIVKRLNNKNISQNIAIPLCWIWASIGVLMNKNKINFAYLPILSNMVAIALQKV